MPKMSREYVLCKLLHLLDNKALPTFSPTDNVTVFLILGVKRQLLIKFRMF